MLKQDQNLLKKMIARKEDSAIRCFMGCYVDIGKKTVYYLKPKLLDRMAERERDKYLEYFKKSVSGKIGSTLLEILVSDIPPSQEISSLQDDVLCDPMRTQFH